MRNERIRTTHITESFDIPPKPEAVFSANGHIKPSYLERYEAFKKNESKMPVVQAVKILEHLDHCDVCSEEQRKIRGNLPKDSLPFED